jgi:hypothetical protein
VLWVAKLGRETSNWASASDTRNLTLLFGPHLSGAAFFSKTLGCLRNVFEEPRTPALLSDAEGAEDQVEDVIGGGGAGDGIEGPESVIEIEQQHFVRNFRGHGAGGGFERSD